MKEHLPTSTYNRSIALAAYVSICIIWGTTYYGIVVGLKEGFPPFMMGATRFTIAGLVILAAGFASKKLDLRLNFISHNMLIGSIMMGGGQGLIFWAQQYIGSGYASILEASLPLWYVLMDGVHRKKYLHNNKIIVGLGLGFVGILLLFITQLKLAASISNMGVYGALAMLVSCACWVGSSLYYARVYKTTPLLAGLPWQLFGGTLCCFIIALLIGDFQRFELGEVTAKAWLAVSYLAIAGSVVALLSYHWLMRVWPPAVVGTYAYINPVIAVLIGFLVNNEVIGTYEILGMAAILVAAFIVNKGRNEFQF